MNEVKLAGEIVSKPIFSHKTDGKNFYEFYISSKRFSGIKDIIPCIVSDELLTEIMENKKICLHGEITTYNKHEEDHTKLLVRVCVKSVSRYMNIDENYVEIDGYVGKEPHCRKTPLKKEIADILLVANRPYGKSDYIPCICWDDEAREINMTPAGTELKIYGRIQSRPYIKKLEDGTQERRVAYEVSAKKTKILLWGMWKRWKIQAL